MAVAQTLHGRWLDTAWDMRRDIRKGQEVVSCDNHTHTLPEKVIQTSSCTIILLYKFVIQTVLGMGMGMNVTAQAGQRPSRPCRMRRRPSRTSGAGRAPGRACRRTAPGRAKS